MWQMAQLLAGKAQQEVKEATAELDMSAVALKALLPDKTGFQLLTQPLMARGLGLRLKRNLPYILYCWLPCIEFSDHNHKILSNF